MKSLRLFDPDRRPTSWTEIVRPGQFVVFSKTIETGAPCDTEGRGFPSVEHATCVLFDNLSDARVFCERQVIQAPQVRFEIFDSTGRAHAPLYVIVHPSKQASLEGNRRGMRIRTIVAAALLVVSAGLFWYDYQQDRGMAVFPTLLGINLVVVAARLFQLNGSYAHAERQRQKRLEDLSDAAAQRHV